MEPLPERHIFQIAANFVHPDKPVRAGNLFTEYDTRRTSCNQAAKFRPDIARILVPLPFSGRAEWLAWTASRPDGKAFWPAGDPQGFFPSSDSGEEMASIKPSKIASADFADVPDVDVSMCDRSSVRQVRQPFGREAVEFVVVCALLHSLPFMLKHSLRSVRMNCNRIFSLNSSGFADFPIVRTEHRLPFRPRPAAGSARFRFRLAAGSFSAPSRYVLSEAAERAEAED